MQPLKPSVAAGAAMAASQGADEETRMQEAELAKKLSKEPPGAPKKRKLEDVAQDKIERAEPLSHRIFDLLTTMRGAAEAKKD